MSLYGVKQLKHMGGGGGEGGGKILPNISCFSKKDTL